MPYVILLNQEVTKKLAGRCIRRGGQVVSKNGEVYDSCAVCNERCGTGALGYTEGVGIRRSFGGDEIELYWGCPGCGAQVTEKTTALESIQKAAEIKRDPRCYKCRNRLN